MNRTIVELAMVLNIIAIVINILHRYEEANFWTKLYLIQNDSLRGKNLLKIILGSINKIEQKLKW